MTDFPIASHEYGHKIDRAERSAEVYRIGGLMDLIDSWEITASTLMEAFGIPRDRADMVSKAIFARLANAEHAPIMPCRIYEVEEDDN